MASGRTHSVAPASRLLESSYTWKVQSRPNLQEHKRTSRCVKLPYSKGSSDHRG